MNPESLEAESAVVRVYAPLQGGSVPRMKPKEQARRGYAARKLYRAQRNVNTSVVLEANALGAACVNVCVSLEAWGERVEVPETLVAVTATLRKMAKNSEDCITAIEHVIRQLRAPTKWLGPTPEESVVEASRLAELLARPEKES